MNERQRAWYKVYSGVSVGTIKELHSKIREQLRLEDAQAPEDRECRVREHPDFREQAEVFERVLEDRGQHFERIDWAEPVAGPMSS